MTGAVLDAVLVEARIPPVYNTVLYAGGTYGGTWAEVTDVIVDEGVEESHGIFGQGPMDRVAGTGTVQLVLDNSDQNSAGLVGYYTPGHANARAGWELEVEVRWRLCRGETYGSFYYGAEYWGDYHVVFVGRVKNIDIDPDTYGTRRVTVSAEDWFAEAAQHNVSRISVQQNQRSDQVISAILADQDRQPYSQNLAVGIETFAYALDDLKDERTRVLAALQKVVVSEFGYLYLRGDAVDGGQLVFQNRHTRIVDTVTQAVLADANIDEMKVARTEDLIYNLIRSTSYPRQVSAAADQTLFQLYTPFEITPGATQVYTGRYTDPNNRDVRISGISMVTPVAGTHYNFSSAAGTDNGDLNGNLIITASFGANSVEYTLMNNGPTTGYMTKLKAIGKSILAYEPVVYTAEDADSQDRYGVRELDLDLPYQNSPLVAKDLGDTTITDYEDARNRVMGVGFWATTAALMNAALLVDVGQRITLTEAVSGVSGVFVVQGVRRLVDKGKNLHCSWDVMPGSVGFFWLVGSAGFSEIGQTTIVGS